MIEQQQFNWRAITVAELTAIIETELIDMNAELRERFRKTATNLIQVSCRRAIDGALENIFLVAASTTHLLIFDDVEDEFGVAARPTNGEPVLEWDLLPDLESGFRAFLSAAE